MKLKFKRELDKWYIDYPQYTGPKADLEMVSGADSLCQILSFNKDNLEVTLTETLTPLTSVILHRWIPFQETEESAVGGYYRADFENGKLEPFDIWLCEVTLQVLGKYPSVIYIQ